MRYTQQIELSGPLSACADGATTRVAELSEDTLIADGSRVDSGSVAEPEADALMGGSFEADVLFIHGVLPARKQTMAFRCESSVSPVTTPTHRFRRFQHSIASPFN